MAATTTKVSPLPCSSCAGDGTVEVRLPARHASQITPEYERRICPWCHGSKVARCASCSERATLLGESGAPYCGTAHAYDAGDWPACRHCDLAAQSPESAPFCSQSCTEAFLARVEFFQVQGVR